MSQGGPDRELPPDLEMLGARLEKAAARSLRHRARRQAILNAIAAVALAVPLALAVSASELGPSGGERSPVAQFAQQRVAVSASELAHIKEERLPPPAPLQCLDANDCRSPEPPPRNWAPARGM